MRDTWMSDTPTNGVTLDGERGKEWTLLLGLGRSLCHRPHAGMINSDGGTSAHPGAPIPPLYHSRPGT
jgi:hypothetical protein|nr:hypothetical protein Q903MT_gene805 [Picea sitchensis]